MADRPIDQLPVKTAAQLALTDYLVGHDDGEPAGFRSQLGQLIEFFSLAMPSGTFTPTLVTTGDPMTISYVSRSGRWARVGPLVYVTGRIEVDSVSGGTGNLRIGNLPFITASNEAHRGSVGLIIGNADSWPSNTSSLLAMAIAGEANLGVYAAGPTTGISSFTPANIKAATIIRFGGWYFTDDPYPS